MKHTLHRYIWLKRILVSLECSRLQLVNCVIARANVQARFYPKERRNLLLVWFERRQWPNSNLQTSTTLALLTSEI